MNGQRGQLSTLIGRTLLGLAATAVTAVLLAPTVAASPMGDAEDAMMAAWEKAGGDTSTLGVRKGRPCRTRQSREHVLRGRQPGDFLDA